MLRAAITLADESGIESLSMRKLGQELGVEAMSLYNHVANKDDLLNGIVDAVTSEIEVPPADVDWKEAIRRTAISSHDGPRAPPLGVQPHDATSPGQSRADAAGWSRSSERFARRVSRPT